MGAAALVQTSPVAGRAGGIVTDNCQACHSGGDGAPTVSLTAEPSAFNPGDAVTFTLTLRSTSIRVGGAFITAGGVGTLQARAGEGLAVNGQGLTHTAPKAAANGAVTFRFGWQAPAKAGGLDVRVAALAGNGNNAPTGDSAGGGDFQWVFGCPSRTFYLDLDRDGYGSKDYGTLLGCAGDAAPTGYASMDGDCDENDEKVHPGATEICNKKDDNCDGQVDENAPAVMMWPDGDGDGYYKSQTGTPKVGCGNLPGYAARGGDCNDADAAIHPGATEICNNKDDNCDGTVDERVRPQCGVGWCARYSPSCDPADCLPGPPAAETCNDFDDDCDGELDNGACPTGQMCAGHGCVAIGSGGAAPSGGATGGGAAVGGAPGGGMSSGGSTAGDTGGTSGTGARPSESGCAVLATDPTAQEPETRHLCAFLLAAAGLGARWLRARKR